MSKSQNIDMGNDGQVAADIESFRVMVSDLIQATEASLQLVETSDGQEDKLQTARKKARLSVRPEAVRVDTVTEKFAGFNLTINHDPIGKKKNGNGFLIETQGERTAATLRLSLREARALRSFLAKHIPDSE